MDGKIYIVGQIGTVRDPDGNIIPGVELVDIISQVKSQPEATSFTVHIDSPGGSVPVGESIYNYLIKLKKPVTTIGSNMVASIATVIFMAGSKRFVNDGCEFMIHLPMGGIDYATADELQEYTKIVRATENKMIKFYCKVTGLEEEAIKPLLQNETWLTPEQLNTLGFTTAESPLKIAAKAFFNKPNKQRKKMSDKKKGKKNPKGLKAFLKMIEKAMSDQVVNLILLTADQVEVDFYELSDGDEISEGARARIDGSDAEGTFTMADGRVVTFSAGSVTDIQEAEEEDAEELAKAKVEIAKLKKANGKLATKNSQLTKVNGKMVKSLKKVKKLKSQFAEDGDGKKKNTNKGKKGKGKSAFSTALAGIKNK